jgi:hypothetical protein
VIEQRAHQRRLDRQPGIPPIPVPPDPPVGPTVRAAGPEVCSALSIEVPYPVGIGTSRRHGAEHHHRAAHRPRGCTHGERAAQQSVDTCGGRPRQTESSASDRPDTTDMTDTTDTIDDIEAEAEAGGRARTPTRCWQLSATTNRQSARRDSAGRPLAVRVGDMAPEPAKTRPQAAPRCGSCKVRRPCPLAAPPTYRRLGSASHPFRGVGPLQNRDSLRPAPGQVSRWTRGDSGCLTLES